MRQKQDLALAELKHWVWAAQRQLQRFTAAYLQEYGSAATGTTIERPERIYSNTSSDVYVLCHVVLQMIKAQSQINKRAGLPRFDERIATTVGLLCQLHGNWEVNRCIAWVPAPTDRRNLSKEARAFVRAFPNKNPFSVTLEAGSPVIADLLDLNDLSGRLFELERAITQAEGGEEGTD